ncbi:MAG: metalloregulator ArsR/SmtB family transcription factor [Hellea sp.]|nr:metalloregulator ArsR/SmtB family transcription factor [Hellea sp.]
MEHVLTALKAMGHSERLRIVALLSYGELTISELVKILGLSQPRVTQYMKSLEDARVIERVKEGSWVFSRINRSDRVLFKLVSTVLAQLPPEDAVLMADRRRLEDVRAARAFAADNFFTQVANDDGQLGDEYLPREDLDLRVHRLIGEGRYEFMVDLGTGTGRMLELLAGQVERGAGVDNSAEMLKVARHKLAARNFGHLSVRLGDLTATPFASGVADLVTVHQVLHYLDDPGEAIREAGRILRNDGKALLVDFAAHSQEDFREKYAHRRLGFNDQDITQWAAENHMQVTNIETITTHDSKPNVKLWLCEKKAV